MSQPAPADRAPLAGAATADPRIGADRLATILPPQLLQEGEAVLLLTRPSRWYILLGPLGFLVAVPAAAWAGRWLDAWVNDGRMSREILLLGLTLVALRVGWQALEWLSRVYVLTDRRVLRVQGVIRVSVFEARLNRLQHTGLYLSLRERLFGLGTVTFSTAGTGLIEAAWVYLHDPLGVHRRVLEARTRAGGPPEGAGGGAEA